MSRLSDPDLIFQVPFAVLDRSLEFLRSQGRRGHEGVALWAGRFKETEFRVLKAIIPAQRTGRLFYRISSDETFRILDAVSNDNMVIPIQIHSHPKEAFHSGVDDEDAFIRQENAISIVVPHFGSFPNDEFLLYARFYRLREETTWVEMKAGEVGAVLRFEGI
jgi:hypothetical protein